MCGRPHTLGFVVQNVFLCLGCLLILKAVIDRGIYFRECFGWTGPLKGTMHWNSSLDMWQRWQTARAEARQVIVTHLSLHYMLQQAWQINHWGERTRVGRSGWGEKTSKGSKEKISLHQIQISFEALGVFFPLLGFYSSCLGECVSNLPASRVCFCRCGKSCQQITAGRPQILLLLEDKLGNLF